MHHLLRLVSGRVSTCRIKFGHIKLSHAHWCPLMPHKKLPPNQVTFCIGRRFRSISLSWKKTVKSWLTRLGKFHAISLSIWISIAKLHILKHSSGLLRKQNIPKQHHNSKSKQKNILWFHHTYIYILFKYVYTFHDIKYVQYTTAIKSGYKSTHFISPHFPSYPHVSSLWCYPPQSRWNLSVLEALTNLQGNLPPHILVCCSTEQRFTAYHGAGWSGWMIHVLRKVCLQIQILAVLDSLSNFIGIWYI